MLHIHQSLLDENSSHIFNQIESLARDLETSSLLKVEDNLLLENKDCSLHKELLLEFYLELFHVYLNYGVISKIQQVIKKINQTSDLTMTLRGKCGMNEY